MLSNAYFLAKFRFDTAENEPAKSLQKIAIFAKFADALGLRELVRELRAAVRRHGPGLVEVQVAEEGALAAVPDVRALAVRLAVALELVRGEGRAQAHHVLARADADDLHAVLQAVVPYKERIEMMK